MKAERTVQTMKTQHGPEASSDASFVVNARYRAHRITGVQRYAHEIVNRLDSKAELLAPRKGKGALGHLWEQISLPRLAAGRLLWSPCGAGPIAYSRQVVTIHDLFPIENPEWYSTAYARWYKLMFTQLAQKAVHLIAVSHYTKDRIVQVLGRDPSEITVVHNGPSAVTQLTSALEASRVCAALALPTRRYVLSLSSLEGRKNLPTILAAWREAQRWLPDNVWLVLAGQQPDAAVFGKQKLAAIPARVHFTGYVAEEHLAGLYSGASLFLFPSLAEGFGLPLLEAMSCGVRSITSNNSSFPQVGGDAAWYVDPLDVSALSAAIRRYMPKENAATAPFIPALEQASRFSWSHAAQITQDVLKRAASAVPVETGDGNRCWSMA
jgi:glycosyltransferase involved in cell wall biosynthesis